MDALALLKRDHQTVEKLFSRFEKKPSKEIADRFVRELSVHAAIEEQLFYPAVRQLAEAEEMDEAKQKVLEALEEHHVAKWVLSEIEDLDADDERFEAKCMVLIESVRHHVKEEEGPLFRLVRRLFKRDQLAELGKLMQKAKKIAPTHPHPRAPDEPPGNVLAGGLAAILDRGRDAVKSMVASRAGRRSSRDMHA
jgi:hemerythrin superfamily protein